VSVSSLSPTVLSPENGFLEWLSGTKAGDKSELIFMEAAHFVHGDYRWIVCFSGTITILFITNYL